MPGLPSDTSGQQPQAQIPKLYTDPVWSLDLFPLEVDFGSRTFHLPPMPAVRWLIHLMNPDASLYDLIVDLFGELEDCLYDNMSQVTITDLYNTVLEVIGVVAGRPWWVAIRIIQIMGSNWHVLGPQLIMSGIDARALPLSAWLDCSLYILINSMDPKDVEMFSLKLETKPDLGALAPEGEEYDPMEAFTVDRDAFFAMGA